jgi:hypothetical protein
LADVEVSFDGGLNWVLSRLEPRNARGWQRFAIDWQPAGSGTHVLMSRAVAPDGRRQPEGGRRNAVYPVSVDVS